MEKLFFLSGLPRSGSTWLAAILNQNPNIFVTPSSPWVELLWRHYSMWDESLYEELFSNEKIKKSRNSYLKKITKVFYEELTDKPIVIDRERFWQNSRFRQDSKFRQDSNGELPKIICPVRNVEEIEASCTLLFNNNNKDWNTSNMKDVFNFAYQQFQETYESEYRKCLLLIDYNDLVSNTDNIINSIYNFIGEPNYKHNLDTIFIDRKTNDSIERSLGLFGLHNVKKGVKKSETNPEEVLGEVEYFKFKDLNFWNKSERTEAR